MKRAICITNGERAKNHAGMQMQREELLKLCGEDETSFQTEEIYTIMWKKLVLHFKVMEKELGNEPECFLKMETCI